MASFRDRLAILSAKLIRVAAKALGRGSSIPGQIALKISPNLLASFVLPENIIAVTGSNGKTSTVNLINSIAEKSGLRVLSNLEGSNQIEGITTLLATHSNLRGEVEADLIVLESDERYARHTFSYLKPKYYVITNLYRDQLTRNVHPEWMYDIIAESIHEGTTLVLNADDPLVSKFGIGRKDSLYFGVEHLAEDSKENHSLYNDGYYCPNCYHPMEYDFYHYAHIGNYHCSHCGYQRHATKWAVSNANLSEGWVEINGQVKIHLPFNSIYQCYNSLAAYAACRLAGIASEDIVKGIESYHSKTGRIITYKVNGQEGTLLLSKHENSVSYNQSIRYIQENTKSCQVIILVDAISRKYYTSDSSWLWDIDFENLNLSHVKEIILAGQYAWDLRERFHVGQIAEDKIQVCEDYNKLTSALAKEKAEHSYVITCFSDYEKFIKLPDVEVTGGL